MRSPAPSKRVLAYGALLTGVVTVLAGVAAELTLFASAFGLVAPGPSGPVATLAVWLVVALVVLALASWVAVPVGSARRAVGRGDRHWSSAAVWATAAILGLPWFFGSYWMLAGKDGWDPTVGAAVLVAGPLLAVAGARVAAALDADGRPAGPPPGVFAGLVLAVAVVGATVAVPHAVDAPTGDLVESRTLNRVQPAPPDVSFRTDYRSTGEGRGVLTLTHDGGPAAAGNVTLRGTDFADVPGANQTAPGPWAGETSGPDGEPTVRFGDSVTVGVAADCEVRVVFEGMDPPATVALVECLAADGSGPDAAVRPPGRGR